MPKLGANTARGWSELELLQRVLIANRGAVARRIIRACRKLGIESVSCHSDIDTETPAVEEADHAVRLPGYRAADTYLNADLILQRAEECEADSIHPGYGFLAESTTFARSVQNRGMTWIGPAPEWIERMGNKTLARREMREKGFPSHEGSEVLDSPKKLQKFADRVGFPLLLKPVAGGGGIGMFVVENQEELPAKFKQAQALASRAFSDASLYAEKYLSKPRHIEFQILGDGEECISLGERDCSVQRRHQKLIEESPAPAVDRTLLQEIETKCNDALRGYDSIGTVECLYADQEFGFLEMNTRLQVEHGVTEEAIGVDLVEAQLRLASGESLSDLQLDSVAEGKCAVEARLYAEDSEKMLPSTGRLNVFRPVHFKGVRIETAYKQGNFLSPYYDPLLAKIIATGSSREQAIARTTLALKAFEIQGVATNSELLQNVLGSEAFILGRMHTELLSEVI